MCALAWGEVGLAEEVGAGEPGLVVQGAPPTAGGSPTELDALGEAAWQRAYRYYEAAFKNWTRLAEQARGLSDAPTYRRALVARAELAVLLRFPAKITTLERELGSGVGDLQVAQELRTRAARGDAPLRVESTDSTQLQDLGKLLRFLKSSERVAARSALDGREILLLREMVAVVERWLGDFEQLVADRAYEAALTLLRESSGKTPAESLPQQLSLLCRSSFHCSAAAAFIALPIASLRRCQNVSPRQPSDDRCARGPCSSRRASHPTGVGSF